MADSREPSWGEVFDVLFTARLRGVHTAMMGEIRSYSEAKETAEVTFAVHLETAEGQFVEVPPLGDVPVVLPGAWEAGDSCLLVFCEESFAKWFDTGSVEPPEVLRRHGLHAVCIPLVARAGQDVQFVALANLVQTALDKIQYAFDNHTHATAAPGTPSPPIPVPAAAPPPVVPLLSVGPVAATKVKAR
ncbi:MAG TPA: Gp138 family membrane-puncturing spike protein [Gaiellaceae bacterium]